MDRWEQMTHPLSLEGRMHGTQWLNQHMGNSSCTSNSIFLNFIFIKSYQLAPPLDRIIISMSAIYIGISTISIHKYLCILIFNV